jgi:hypothetical protein
MVILRHRGPFEGAEEEFWNGFRIDRDREGLWGGGIEIEGRAQDSEALEIGGLAGVYGSPGGNSICGKIEPEC